MCGIIGFFASTGTHDLMSGLQALAHRGPDDRGSYVDSSSRVGLGHARLSILDTSQLGHQPMLSSDGQVVLIFNGEIYNFPELRSNLEADGVIFKSQSDSEVLLNLYLAFGESMLTMLNGIFSFAIWDGSRKKMLIARDAFGVKPIYYSSSADGFIFASEIKGLLALTSSELLVDKFALQQYLTFLWSPGERSPIKSIKKLPPGEALWIADGKIEKKWQWYLLPAFRKNNVLRSKSGLITSVETHLREAVHRQMLSDVPVGAFLSGGLDSSAVVAFAREKNSDMPCFTIETSGGQEEGMVDDLPYARRVAKHLGVQLNIVTVESSAMASGLENMVAMLDEPLADPAPLNVLYISQLARENGVKVLLSGAGGDDLFTGYRRHYAIQLDQWIRMIPSGIRSGIERCTSSLNVSRPFFRRLAKLFTGSSLEGDERIINYFRWADEKTIRSLFTEEVRMELDDIDAAEPMFEFLKPLPESVVPLERMLALEQRFFLADHNLNYTDKMSMAAGIEVRVPFLDLELVDFAAQIPTKYKQRGSVGKWVLKKAMEPYLPSDVIYRPKTGFGAPLRRWIRFELRELLGDLLSEEGLKKRGIFDPEAVQQLIKNNDTGVVDASYTLLSLMCIEIWCRQFIDGQFNYQKVYGSTP